MAVQEHLDQAASIVGQVRTYIVDNMLLGDDGELENNTSLLDAGILDSTGAMELVAFLEGTFNITVQDEEIAPENLDSIEKICAFVARKSVN
jgi:acyl carrier protein